MEKKTNALIGGFLVGPEGMSFFFTWMRLSSMKQLDWYRNSSYQSKDIAHVQKTITQRIADKVSKTDQSMRGSCLSEKGMSRSNWSFFCMCPYCPCVTDAELSEQLCKAFREMGCNDVCHVQFCGTLCIADEPTCYMTDQEHTVTSA